MSVKSKDEIMNFLKEHFADDNSDEAIGFIEDVSDTYDDLDTRIKENGDWKQKYEQNNKEWHEKYKERFFSNNGEADEPDYDEDPEKPLTFDNLFTTNE
jgi:hypothetical protein